MRNIFFALVVVNLLFAAWHAWVGGSQRSFAPPERKLIGDITLVSELPPGAPDGGMSRAPTEAPASPSGAAETFVAAESGGAASTPSPAAETTPSEAVQGCTSVGPFRELAQAAAAAATLRSAGHEPTQRVDEGDVWIGYWVSIQAIPTESEANEILANVRAQGIDDAYVIPNTDVGNLVSLGVFSDMTGVERRRDEARRVGYEATVVGRTRRANVYWVDVAPAGGLPLDLDALQPPGRADRLEQRNCPTP